MVFKKPVPTGLESFRVPQTTGKPGWLVFTYDNNIPVCVWMTPQECFTVPCSADERICNDTIMRVEKVSDTQYVVADVLMYNSNRITSCSTFQQRYEWLQAWLPMFTFHAPGTIQLLHKSNWTGKHRGFEVYTSELGKPGYFTDASVGERVTLVKLPIPDCYEIKGTGEYLRVPTIETSKFLRTKGSLFSAECINNGDGSWSLVQFLGV